MRATGHRVETLASATFEEAPISLAAWTAQRTRWMKGWMQTFIVHNRAPRAFLRDVGWRGFLAFQLLVGSMIVSAPLHTVHLGTFLAHLVAVGPVFRLPGDPWGWMALAIFTVGYLSAGILAVSGLLAARWLPRKTTQARRWVVLAQLLLPFYWLLLSAAMLLALRELVLDPLRWAKTMHGVTRLARTGDTVATESGIRAPDRAQPTHRRSPNARMSPAAPKDARA